MSKLLVILILLESIAQAFRPLSLTVTRKGFLQRSTSCLLTSTTEKNEIGIDSTSTAVADMEVVIGQTNLLVDIWREVAFPTGPEVDLVLKDYGLHDRDLSGLLRHLQNCKDCAGDGAYTVPGKNIDGDTILSLSKVEFPLLSDDPEDAEGWGSDVLKDLAAMGFGDEALMV